MAFLVSLAGFEYSGDPVPVLKSDAPSISDWLVVLLIVYVSVTV